MTVLISTEPEQTKRRKPLTTAEKKKLLDAVKRMTPEQRKKLLELTKPRMVEPYFRHIPHPKQQVFLGLKNREAMFGGSAGGGKSDALLMAALQYVDVPGYSALILRRTWPDLVAAGAILDRANTWFMNTPAHKRDGGRMWEFPTKDRDGKDAPPARISFGHMFREADRFKYQSAEYQFIGFDELTHFQEVQYTYMFSRVRRPALVCLSCGEAVRKFGNGWAHVRERALNCKTLFPDPAVLQQYPAAPDGLSIFNVPLRMRSATNPGGIGHDWVKTRFIDPKTRDPKAIFVPSWLTDNPSIDRESYVENLMHLNPTDRERLLDGDWDVTEEGTTFQRHWFKVLHQEPATRKVVRFWDHAGTAGGGDFTVGTKLRLSDEGRWAICDVVRGQWSAAEKEAVIRQTAGIDGPLIPIRMEQEPGSAGKDVVDHYRRLVLPGFNFDGIRASGDKELRASMWSSAAEAGNVYIVAGTWNKAFLDEVSQFPNGSHDDQVDSVSGGVSYLAQPGGRLLV
jgi:predicted phage terminase large subunit-like protein